MKFGLEKEYFLVKNNKVIIVPIYIPHDACGLLLEVRGEPKFNIIDAVYSLLAEEFKLIKMVKGLKKEDNLVVSAEPIMVVDKQTRLLASREYEKGLTKYRNLYGYSFHKNNNNEITAGIHLSVTSDRTFKYNKNKEFNYNGIWDFYQFFKYLDNVFKEEIKSTKRLPGFYELKNDGRIEYRSLPNNINLDKLIDVVSNYKDW